MTVEKVFELVPFSGWMIGSAAICLVTLVFVFVVGLRRASQARSLARMIKECVPVTLSPPRPWVEMAGLLSLLLVPAATVISIQSSRQLVIGLLHAAESGRPGNAAENIAAGAAGQANGFPLAVLLICPLLLIGAASIGLATCYRLRVRGLLVAASLQDGTHKKAWLAAPGPALGAVMAIVLSPVILGLLPLASGVWSYVMEMIRGASAMAGADVTDRTKHFVETLSSAGAILDRSFFISMVGLAIAATVSVAVAYSFSTSRYRQRLAPSVGASMPKEGTSIAVFVCTCVGGVVISLLVALPYYRENREPLPIRLEGPLLPNLRILTPDLQGPDKVARMPVLAVTPTTATLDGAEVGEPVRFLKLLAVGKHNWKILRPAEDYPGKFILLSSADTRVERLLPFLAAGLASGQREALLVFQKREEVNRAIMGQLVRHRESGARMALAATDRPVLGMLTASQYGTYGELARAVTTLRKVGKDARLAVPDSVVNRVPCLPPRRSD